MKPPRWFLRVRHYADAKFVSVWVVKRDGPAESGLLFGEVLPAAVAELAAALGLTVETEDVACTVEPMTPPRCVSLVQQRSLWE